MSSSSGTSDNVLRGYVDRGRRPIVRLFFYALNKHIEVMIDTGFTKDLLVDVDFVSRSGFECTTVPRGGILASGLLQMFMVYTTDIEWFGKRRRVEVDVPILNEEVERSFDIAEKRKRCQLSEINCLHIAN